MMQNRRKMGFSLIEMLVALMILVFLVLGIGVGMDAGSRIYRDASFETDSAALAGILNTSLGDILRYSTNTKYIGAVNAENQLSEEEIQKLIDAGGVADTNNPKIEFIISNDSYGIVDAYFSTSSSENVNSGPLQLVSLRNGEVKNLVNKGAYPNLDVTNFRITYKPRYNPGIEGGYFTISYEIWSKTNSEKVRQVTHTVRQLND